MRTQTYEVSGIGSAIPAFVTLGVFDDYKEAISHMVHKKEVFKPDKRQPPENLSSSQELLTKLSVP